MYSEKVAAAYDEICGFDKEAAFDRIKGKIRRHGAESAEDRAYRTETAAGAESLRGKRENANRGRYSDIAGMGYKNKAEKMRDRAKMVTDYNDSLLAQNKILLDAATRNAANIAEMKSAKAESDLARKSAKILADAKRKRQKNEAKADRARMINENAAMLNSALVERANKNIGDAADRYSDIMASKGRSTQRRTEMANAMNDIYRQHGFRAGRAEDAAYRANRASGYADIAEARADARAAAKAERKAQKQAEKAAAYYDEAQYAKEAALADYDEACAYEAAALEVLDELGYLD